MAGGCFGSTYVALCVTRGLPVLDHEVQFYAASRMAIGGMVVCGNHHQACSGDDMMDGTFKAVLYLPPQPYMHIPFPSDMYLSLLYGHLYVRIAGRIIMRSSSHKTRELGDRNRWRIICPLWGGMTKIVASRGPSQSLCRFRTYIHRAS